MREARKKKKEGENWLQSGALDHAAKRDACVETKEVNGPGMNTSVDQISAFLFPLCLCVYMLMCVCGRGEGGIGRTGSRSGSCRGRNHRDGCSENTRGGEQ